MFKSLLDWYTSALQTGGLPLVGLMMAMESTIVPLPSEVIIPPAAHLAYTHANGNLSIAGIILVGTFASGIAGRPLVLRYGRYAMISPEKVEGAERWATHFGSMGVFISRLLPVVRH